MGILHRRCRRFPGTVLDKVTTQRLTAGDQAVMRVRERIMARIRKCEGRWAGYLFFAGIRPVYLQIIWTASQSESSHSSNSTSRLHRGGLSGRTEGSTFSRALRLVSRLARA